MADIARSVDTSGSRLPLVGIVDADRRVRHSLTDVLRLGGVRVAGAAATSGEALALVEMHRPDLIVIDPHLPSASAGAALLAGIRTRWPWIRVVLIGWREAAQSEVNTPVAVYVSKTAAPEEFVRAILTALQPDPPAA
ncbi:hypothetical protein BH24CHL6_BH24CHL6_03990 [soil metagenome]